MGPASRESMGMCRYEVWGTGEDRSLGSGSPALAGRGWHVHDIS